MIEVPEAVKPNNEMHSHTPLTSEIIYTLGNDLQRCIFYNVQTTQEEDEQLQYLQHISISIGQKLRFIHANDFDPTKTRDAIDQHTRWREIFPCDIKSLYNHQQNLLYKSGVYIHGRDSHFRPVLYISLAKVDLKRYLVNDYEELLVFMWEYMIANMLLPGKVEQWVLFFDMCNEWLTLTMTDFYRIIEVLQSNYPERLNRVYIFRPPSNIDTLHTHLIPKLGAKTSQKIILENSKLPHAFFRNVSVSQLERKYGGTAMNVKHCWPPSVPQGSFKVEIPSTEAATPSEYYSSEVQTLTQEDPMREPWRSRSISYLSVGQNPSGASASSKYDVIIIEDTMDQVHNKNWCSGCYDRYDNESHPVKSFCSLL